MQTFLDLGDGSPLIPCRDDYQALLLARLYVALMTGQPAIDLTSRTSAIEE